MKVDLRTIKPEKREQARQLEAEVNKALQLMAETDDQNPKLRSLRWFTWSELDNKLFDFCMENRVMGSL